MGTSDAGRWTLAAALVAAVVAAFLMLMRADVEPGTATNSEERPVTVPPDVPPADAVVGAAPKRDAPRRVAASSASSTPGEPKRAAVVVRVTAAEDDRPIANASVFVGTIAGTTDAAGTARFEHLEACEWSFEASAPGRFKRSFRRAISAGAETTIDLRLAATAVIAVRVEDRETGAPIDRARIEVDAVGLDFKDKGTTGDDGERLLSVPAEAIVRVTADGSAREPFLDTRMTSVRAGPAGSTTPVVLRLVRPGRLTGVVRAPDGAVVSGATVRVDPQSLDLSDADEWPPPGAAGDATRTATSGPDGRFEVRGLVRGRRYVALAAPGDGSWATSETLTGLVVLPDGPDAVRDFTLRDFGSVIVRVTDDNGAPVANASVMVSEGKGVGTFPGGRDEPGTYRIPRRPPGTIAILVWSPGGTALRRVVVPAGGTAEADVVLGRLDTVKCVVVDDVGGPVAGAKIESRVTVWTVAFQSHLTTDASGTAALPNFRAGARRLTVTAPGMLTAIAEPPADSTDDVRVVMRRAAVLTFRVLGADGAPCAEGFRVLFGDDARPTDANSSDDGRVRLDCEPRGETDVWLVFDAGAPLVLHATLAPGAVADLGDVRLSEARRIAGRVVDAAGRPVEGAFVGLNTGTEGNRTPPPASYRFKPEIPSLTEPDGSFSVEFAPPSGPLPIEVSADGFLDLRAVVTVRGDAPLTLTLQRGGLVWGEVAEAFGAPRGGAAVRVLDARGAGIAETTSGPQGEFDLRVAPGRYTVRADGCDDVSVELREGADEHVTLTERAR